MLELLKIQHEAGTQARESINEAKVSEYAEHLENGGEFPPVVVFFDGDKYWLADGWHRFLAHQRIGMLKIHERVELGTKRDAMLYSFGANATHGLPRTNADKRRAVSLMLADPEWVKWSDSEIARRCCVSQPFVGKLREPNSYNVIGDEQETRKFVTKKGTESVIKLPQKPVLQQAAIESIPAPTPEPEAEEPAYDPRDDEVAELRDTVQILAEENEVLKFKAAPPTQQVLDFEELVKKVTKLEIQLSATESSRDAYMRKCEELQKQCAMQARELKRLKGEK